MERPKDIEELTAIRFFAALHVVLFHNLYLSGSLAAHLPSWLISMISYGDCAVSFFFILSGFILTYAYVGRDLNLKTTKGQFWWARFSRIYPVYLFAFLLDLPRGLHYFFSTNDLGTALFKISTSASAHIGLLQSWYPRLTPSWNSPAWSISTEAFFYLMFPFIIPWVFKLKNKVPVALTLYFLPIVTYYSMLKFGIDLEQGMAATFWRSFPLIRLPEFMIGILLGQAYIQNTQMMKWLRQRGRANNFLFWSAAALSLYLISFAPLGHYPRGIFSNTFLLPLFSLMIISLAANNIRWSGFLRAKLMLLLGSASYALYIIHIPLVHYTGILFSELSISYGGIYFFGYLLMTVTASIVVYKGLELPVQKWLRNKNHAN